MTNSISLAQIEDAIRQLSYDERVWLIERLVHGLRQCSTVSSSQNVAALAEMAADPEIRRELAVISEEFGHTEMDGLEQF
jgi:uroporphyrinogen-III synthase